jgi:hypothetical protein
MVWAKLGLPAKREEYVAKVPEGVDINVEALRDAAEVAGLTKGQFEKLVAKTVQGAQAVQLQYTKDRDALRAEWGPAYETKLKNASAVAQKMGEPDTVVAAILGGKMPSSALKRWDIVATAVGKEGTLPANGGGGQQGLTAAEVQARFREVQTHPAYFNKNHPEHDVYVQKGFDLQKQLHPD